MAIGDMIALSVAERIHVDKGEVFKKNHPGGAIGESAVPHACHQEAVTPLELVELPSPSISATSDI